MEYITDIHMVFDDERGRKDFENCFKGWVTEWQTQQMIMRRLVKSTAAPEEIIEDAAGLTPPTPHSYGVTSGEDGLLTIEDLSITVAGVTVDVGDLYLNIIPFF